LTKAKPTVPGSIDNSRADGEQQAKNGIEFSVAIGYIPCVNNTVKHTVYTLLLAGYILVAAAGNIVLLRELLNSGNGHHQVTEGNGQRPLPGSPVWSVKSSLQQIHQSEQTLHIVPAEVIVDPNRHPVDYQFPHFQSRYTHLECLPSKPRDPPLA
jgi:hypothetical protein